MIVKVYIKHGCYLFGFHILVLICVHACSTGFFNLTLYSCFKEEKRDFQISRSVIPTCIIYADRPGVV